MKMVFCDIQQPFYVRFLGLSVFYVFHNCWIE